MKEIINISDISIFLVESNLVELSKSRSLLDMYINNWNINKQKINIIFNKYNKNSIDTSVLKKLFSDFKILGKIKMSEKYNLIINSNLRIIDNNIKKEYLTIIKKL